MKFLILLLQADSAAAVDQIQQESVEQPLATDESLGEVAATTTSLGAAETPALAASTVAASTVTAAAVVATGAAASATNKAFLRVRFAEACFVRYQRVMTSVNA